MRNSLKSLALAAFLIVPGFASAEDANAGRTQAIQLCRAEIAQQAGVEPAEVRLDQVRVRSRQVRADFDLWRDGQLTNVRCDVPLTGEALVATINPSLQLASASR